MIDRFTSPRNPFALVSLIGESKIRGVTLVLPSERVRDFLPGGLELGPQDVTPRGTHPVILLFQENFRVQMSVPTLFPSVTYHEYIFSVPYCYLSPDSITPGYPGPYYFMPRLYLDNAAATAVGALCWGYAKQLGAFQVRADRYTVQSAFGPCLTSVSWKPKEDQLHAPVHVWRNFLPVRRMLDQPIISQMPAAMGPFFVLSDFDRHWDASTLCPLHTAVEVNEEFVLGYEPGRYPVSGWSPGIDESPLGSYELRTSWRLSLPYPALFSFR